jgi:GTP-binding protein LepA
LLTKKNPETALVVNNPTDLPEPSLDHVEEPFIKATIITKADFVGNVMSLCIERGLITNQTYLTTERVELTLTCR